MTSNISDLLGAYALGAVDGAERSKVEKAVARDSALLAQVESYLDVVASLDELALEDAPPLDPAVWERIEAATGRVEPERTLRRKLASVASRTRRRGRLFTPFAVAAVLALAVVSVRVVQLSSDNEALEAALDRPLVEAAEQARLIPGSSFVTLSAPTASATVSVDVVYQPDGIGYLIGDGLPVLAPDRTYQLWAIVEGRVISAGVLGNRPGVAPFQVVGELEGLAVTEEIAGGVVSSENDPVAVWLAEA